MATLRLTFRFICAFAALWHLHGYGQDADGSTRVERVTSRSLIEDLNSGDALGAAPQVTARELFPLAPQLIMHFEGWEPRPYDDPAGYCTVGYGHLIAKAACSSLKLEGRFSRPLDLTEGAALLDADSRTARVAVQQLVKIDLNNAQFGALSSFVFNVGKQNFASSTLLKLLNKSEMSSASKEFGRWVQAKGVVHAGLVARRACEEALFLNRLSGTADRRFVRSDCTALGAAPTGGPLIDIEVGEK